MTDPFRALARRDSTDTVDEGGRRSSPDPRFPRSRLERAGVAAADVRALEHAWAELDEPQRASFAAHARSASNDDLRAYADEHRRIGYTTHGRIVEDVLDDVNADPLLLDTALASELAARKPRVTLLAELEELVRARDDAALGSTGTEAAEVEAAPLADEDNLTPATTPEGDLVDDVPPSDATTPAPTE